jgi:hypothetical protein
MTSKARKAGLISEQGIKEALVEAKGDIFLAACALDCTARELDGYIRRSAVLQAFSLQIEQIKIDPAYSRMSVEQFENKLLDLGRAYRIDGLTEIHKLATMEFGDSAALAKVKLDAAIALRGGVSNHAASSESENVLSELNALYHANAPRIKEIRQTVLVLQDDREAIPLTIEQPPGQ